MISFEPSPDELALRDVVHRFATEKMRPLLRVAEEAGVPDRLGSEFRELGLGLMTLPAAVGGADLGARAIAVIEEELAWGDPGLAVAFPRPGLAGHVVAALEVSLHERWLAPFASDAAVSAAAAVRGGGQGIGARVDGDQIVLSGACDLVQAERADWLLMAARLDGALALVGIKHGTPGSAFTPDQHRLGLRTASFGRLVLDECRLPASALLATGTAAERALRHGFQRELVTYGAWAVGTGRAAFEYAARYATERQAFGRPIAEHQAVAFMVAEMGIGIEAARGLTWHAAWALDAGEAAAGDLTTAAALAAGEASVRVTSDAVQVLGGHGYIQDHPVEKWMRDARTLANLINEIAGPQGLAGP